MGVRSRQGNWNSGPSAWALMLLLAVLSCASLAAPKAPTATPVATSQLEVARLDQDPVPARILTGEFDGRFVPVPEPVVRERGGAPRWWRITTKTDIPADGQPHLVLTSPHQARVETWTPDKVLPVTRSLYGPDADPGFSTRGLVFPLPGGLAEGEAVYLRVHATTAMPMEVRVEPLARVHRADLVHVAWRSAILISLLLLSVLALGFWIGIGERSYGYLLLTLFAQAAFFAAVGGEIRMVPGLPDSVLMDPRIPRLIGLVGALASVVFLVHYLDLRDRHPLLARLLMGCGIVFGVLVMVTLVAAPLWIAHLANLTLLVATVIVMVAAAAGVLRGHRASYFVFFSWLPMLVLLAISIAGVTGPWNAPAWLSHAFPASFVLAGLVLMIGLSDTLQQLRRDRDHASRLATFDGLTGAMSRPAIEARLKAAVEEAHKGRLPLSVVFFDIDHFKRINDDYGHRVGDSCLKIIALRTRNRLRTYDLFGRWGGDEIVVLLPDTRFGEAMGVAENLRSAVNCRPLSIDRHLFQVTLSLGVAELVPGETAEDLLERADAALYASKQGGRDRVSGRPGHQRELAQAGQTL